MLFAILTALGLIAALYFGTNRVLLGGFSNVEQDYVSEKVTLVERTLNAELDALEAHAVAWSAWNSMYTFAKTRDDAFAQSELGAAALGSMDIDFFVVVDPAKEVLFARLLGEFYGEKTLPFGVQKYLGSGNLMLQHTTVHDVHAEITAFPEGPLLVVSAPIVTSNFAGPVRGTLVIGRLLNSRRLGSLEEITGLSFSLYPAQALPQDLETGARSNLLAERTSTAASVSAYFSSRDEAKGYSFIRNGAGQDTLLLEVRAQRPIHIQALKTRAALLAVLAFVSLVVVAFTLVFLHRSILSRLNALRNGVRTIARDRLSGRRLSIKGHDEFAMLAADTNEMLDSLEAAKQEATENEARYALVAQGINDGIWDWNLLTGETYYSDRWRSMLGYGDGEVVASAELAQGHIHPDDRDRVRNSVTGHLKGDVPFLETEVRMRMLDGSYRWMLLRGAASRDETGRATRLAGSLTDLTRRGLFDALTGLPNRLLLKERLGHTLMAVEHASRRQSALLYMDLNRFKIVNDSLGHHVGDLLIVEVAKRMQSVVRHSDIVARIGGDEFVILMDDLGSAENLARAVQRISDVTTTVCSLAGHDVAISMSIGVVSDLSTYSDVADVLRDADNAMYHAKAARKPYVYFDKDMLVQAQERLELESDLKRAIDSGALKLVFQPVILLKEAKMRGVEALARWHHPTRGDISPTEFIALAEETGLIGPLGDWVLHEACHQMVRLGGDFSLGVNLSSKQLDNTLIDRVAGALKETGLPAHRLILEITESAVVRDPLMAAGVLAKLRTFGVRIALDDFGTGYSSLSYLSTLPLDILKIDRTFVSRLMADAQSVAIVRGITTIAQSLGLSVVAEGVESAKEAELLKELGCAYAQGYHFAAPVPLEALTVLSQRTFAIKPIHDYIQTAN